VNQPTAATAIDVASMPWVFTQTHPLDTRTFIDEAKKRGFDLDLTTLRELYRHGLLVPFVEVTYRPVREPCKPDGSEPIAGSTRLMNLREARDTGCLRDLSSEPFKRHLQFEHNGQKPRGWWNGFIYSWYQLLALPVLKGLLDKRTYQKRGTQRIARLPTPHPLLVDRIENLRSIVLALIALEARYLPKLDPQLIQLNNADWQLWEPYRDRFDPVSTQEWLHYSSDQIRRDAEDLLFRASRLDQFGSEWGELMRRAPAKAQEGFKGGALQALDLRTAAEILLLFYEDLAGQVHAEPLPDFSGSMGWHPLVERLSYRGQSLDENLVSLGISPHPRVILALEGDTEMYHAPRVQAALEFTDAPELLRFLKLGAANRDLAKLAALAAAPLVSEKVSGADAWKLIKPYTKLFVAVDPDAPFTTPEKVASERTKILDEIKDVLKAQGVERPNPSELDHLVEIRTWNASCYEFAHFTDEELSDGIMAIHHTINGLTKDELVASLARSRSRGKDVKEVWSRWEYKVSKVKLAEALWPTLLQKIQVCMTTKGAPIPPIAAVINDAYHDALRRRYQSYVLTETPAAADER
jgi:antitoxin component HigA of HigAB toxin-antitoxin module